MLDLRDEYEKVVRAGGDGKSEAMLREMKKADDGVELDYLRDEVPRACDQTLEGVGRIAAIVRSMQSFAHPGGPE